MSYADFERFFNELLVPLQAEAPMTMKRVPVPDTASAEARLLLENVKGPSAPFDLHNPEQRMAVRALFSNLWKSVEGYLPVACSGKNEPIAGVGCRIFTPETSKDSKKKILYLHGGSYWMGSADANSSIALSLTDKTGLEVISIDYRLAPEHPFPAAQDDVIAVYKALLASGLPPKNITIVGESAGGGLALAATQAIRDLNLPKPAAVGLISPWTDLTFSGDSHKLHDLYSDPWLSVAGLTPAAEAYAGEAGTRHPGVSPLFEDMTGLPPMLIHVGMREIFLSDATRLARKARKARVDVTLDIYEAMWHVWHFYPHVPEGTQALEEMAEFIHEHMG